MEQFKFKKPTGAYDEKFIKMFKREFGEILDDTILMRSRGSYDEPEVTSYSLLKGMSYDVDCKDWDLSAFATKDYEDKVSEYERLIDWLESQKVNYTMPTIGSILCPYLKTPIQSIFLNQASEVCRKFITIDKAVGAKTHYYNSEAVLLKFKPRDLLKFQAFGGNTWEWFMDARVAEILMAHWSYDVSKRISLKGTFDGAVVSFDKDYATVYYKETEQVFENMVYLSQKGVYVKKKSKRIFLSTPNYPTIEESIEKLRNRDIDYLENEFLPHLNHKIYHAIESGVLPHELTPTTQNGRSEVVSKIRVILNSIDNDDEAYEQILRLMK